VGQALARIPALRPDVAVLDVRLPDGNGIELCRELLPRNDGLRCLLPGAPEPLQTGAQPTLEQVDSLPRARSSDQGT
jgi:CheY-like chemotaxis protein